MKKLALNVFFLDATLNLVGEGAGNTNVIYLTKPLLMPLLAAWIILETYQQKGRSFLRHMTLAGLLLAMVGDIMLMFEGTHFFLLGLGSFLLTHLFYIGGFSAVASFQQGFLRKHLWWLLPFIAFPVLLLIGLWKGIPDGMGLPVALYALVLSSMALSIFNLKGIIPDNTFWTLLGGGLLFLLSDSLVALARFGGTFTGAPFAIMVTYIFAQTLIAFGVVRLVKAG